MSWNDGRTHRVIQRPRLGVDARIKEQIELGKNKDVEQEEALRAFIDSGQIDDVLDVIKSGKEATVYLCEGGPLIEPELVAAKVYRSLDVRTFRDDSAYRSGRTRGSSRLERGIALKSRTGKELRFGQWMSAEYETLRILHAAGMHVPAPIAHSGSAVLMEYVCDADGEPAPTLNSVHLDFDQARAVFERVMRDIELMLAHDRVHGDLSPYNVLYRGGQPMIIDFPQAVDPRFNSNALELLERDIDRICAHVAKSGVRADAWRLARDLWGRFLRNEL
jgi:RIO kinase 1